jgi:hypothetical protein
MPHNTNPHRTPKPTETDLNIARATAQNHFTRNHETAWEAIEPLTQTMLTNQAYKWLQDAKAPLIENGWTPPTTKEGFTF